MNRPYSSKMVYENIKGKEIGLSEKNCKALLDKLVDEKKVVQKMNKKQAIYWLNQAEFTEMSTDELRELDEQLKELEKQNQDLEDECSRLIQGIQNYCTRTGS
eukprot:TRINITY_DN7868_c0_g1_i4.p1 TRINITY_DN7868_c0_g1~~TRINITY_DN7868_c0_g1_i4.p1  ORF type:complete len:103 (-),score=23.96 TRINITY_DN7868_c0_g1_i4:42-350(-)